MAHCFQMQHCVFCRTHNYKYIYIYIYIYIYKDIGEHSRFIKIAIPIGQELGELHWITIYDLQHKDVFIVH